MIKRILLVGGGTGGHVSPLVAVAQELQKQAQSTGIDLRLQMMGDGTLLHQSAQELGIISHQVSAPKWRRYFSLLNILDIFKIPLGILQASFFVWLFMPDIVFAKGGYASFLPLLAAKIFFIPVYLHESDAIPGATNRFFANGARTVFLSFKEVQSLLPKARTEVVGKPIRQEILNALSMNHDEAVRHFGFDIKIPTIFITGASQGSQKINETILLMVIELTKEFQVIHQTGSQNFEDIQKNIEVIEKEEEKTFGPQVKQRYHPVASLSAEEMGFAYSAADVVVSRASSSIFEAVIFGKPLVVIPLSTSAGGHQVANAQIFGKVGAYVIEENNLTPHILLNEIKEAIKTKNGDALRSLSPTDAAIRIAGVLIGA